MSNIFKRNKKATDLITSENTSKAEMFLKEPIWKILLKMTWPSLILMFVTGAYMFSDTVLSIHFAADSYKSMGQLSSTDQVKMFMNGGQPINNLINAFAGLFGIGVSTRVAINMGAKRKTNAIETIKTGTLIGMTISFLLIPVLYFSASPWIASQYENNAYITKHAFSFIWIIIISFPTIMFNMIISSLLRTEGKNGQMLFAMIMPIFLNLILDWVMMGPGNLGVEGGAWATFISNGVTTILLVFFIVINKDSLITFKNMFALKGFKMIAIIGISLVGIAPFLRQFSNSITSTVQMSVMTNVSNHIYHDGNHMKVMMATVFPVFMLFFPIMFGFSQAARPIAAFNYGAKQYKRVNKTFYWTVFYAIGISLLIYFLVAFAFGKPLMYALGATGDEVRQGEQIMRIMMLALPLFGFAIGTMAIFGSTDRLLFSIISSSMSGLILFWPIIFGFQVISLNTTYEYAFWWYLPTSMFATSIATGIMVISTLKSLNRKPQRTLDERIQIIRHYFSLKDKSVRKSYLLQTRLEHKKLVAEYRVNWEKSQAEKMASNLKNKTK